MMGPKKARTIRNQLKAALAQEGDDPIQWLENRIRQLEKQRKPGANETEVLQALCRVLKDGKRPKPRRTRTRVASS